MVDVAWSIGTQRMDTLLNVRSEIYDQFHTSRAGPDYFFQSDHADEFAAYYTSMYLIQDTAEAVWTHIGKGFSADPMAAYLEFWGVTQAVVIQQDAIGELHKAVVGTPPAISRSSKWKEFRDMRNLCAGHPAMRKIGVPVAQRAFMGRSFGTYSRIQYELWEEGSGKSTHPTFNLRQMIDDYEQEAVQVLKTILATLKTRWP